MVERITSLACLTLRTCEHSTVRPCGRNADSSLGSAIAVRPLGTLALFSDTSVGDPTSLGVALLLANWTKASRPDEVANDYNTPLQQQLNYILNDAPRTDDGAISHRSEQVQLW